MAYGGWRSMLHRTLLRLARIAYGDSGKCFNNDGTPIPIRELHPDERAMIASVDLDDGGKPTRIKFWNKNEALTELMKPLGLYERNNVQRSENLALQVMLVQPKERRTLGGLIALAPPWLSVCCRDKL